MTEEDNILLINVFVRIIAIFTAAAFIIWRDRKNGEKDEL